MRFLCGRYVTVTTTLTWCYRGSQVNPTPGSPPASPTLAGSFLSSARQHRREGRALLLGEWWPLRHDALDVGLQVRGPQFGCEGVDLLAGAAVPDDGRAACRGCSGAGYVDSAEGEFSRHGGFRSARGAFLSWGALMPPACVMRTGPATCSETTPLTWGWFLIKVPYLMSELT